MRDHTEALLERLIDGLPGVVMLVDAAGTIRWINAAVERVFGVPVEDTLGGNVLDWLDVEWNPLAIESIDAAIAGSGLRRPMLFKVVRRDGRSFVAEVTANSMFDDPVVDGMVVHVRRWDERMLLDEVLDRLASNASLEEVLDLLVAVMAAETLEGDGAVLYDRERGAFQSAVRAPSLPPSLAGGPARHDPPSPWEQAVVAGEVRVVEVAELAPDLRQDARRAGYRACWTWPLSGTASDGSRASAVTGDDPPSACLVLWRREGGPPDHTCLMAFTRLAQLCDLVLERHRADLRLRFAATHDALTGLPNRVLFFERLQDLLEDPSRGPYVGVLYLDLDGFKPVNDRLGHGAGDLVLAEVGRRIDTSVRPSELVARLGGDEFAVVCPDITRTEELQVLADRLVQAIRQPIALGGEQVAVRASIGMSLAPPGACSIDVLVDAADGALYEAKSEHKGGWRMGAVPPGIAH
jgi:diguanylate cyclase (GGDEF)-like protein/PAS domain S-box-containing protein